MPFHLLYLYERLVQSNFLTCMYVCMYDLNPQNIQLLNDVSENNYLMKQDKEETETEAMNVCRKTKIKVVGRNPVGNLVIFFSLTFQGLHAVFVASGNLACVSSNMYFVLSYKYQYQKVLLLAGFLLHGCRSFV